MIFVLSFALIVFIVKKIDFGKCCMQIDDNHDD